MRRAWFWSCPTESMMSLMKRLLTSHTDITMATPTATENTVAMATPSAMV